MAKKGNSNLKKNKHIYCTYSSFVHITQDYSVTGEVILPVNYRLIFTFNNILPNFF